MLFAVSIGEAACSRGEKHNLVGSAGAAKPAQQNRTVVRCLPGDWTAGPVPDITIYHQGENHLRGIRRRDLSLHHPIQNDARDVGTGISEYPLVSR